MTINTKSLLYKQKYYSITFKLCFITKIKFIKHTSKHKLTDEKLINFYDLEYIGYDKIKVYNKFLFDKVVALQIYNDITYYKLYFYLYKFQMAKLNLKNIIKMASYKERSDTTIKLIAN